LATLNVTLTTALLNCLTHHCDIVEIGNESWRSGSVSARAVELTVIELCFTLCGSSSICVVALAVSRTAEDHLS
jgi:hypothetical protein